MLVVLSFHFLINKFKKLFVRFFLLHDFLKIILKPSHRGGLYKFNFKITACLKKKYTSMINITRISHSSSIYSNRDTIKKNRKKQIY